MLFHTHQQRIAELTTVHRDLIAQLRWQEIEEFSYRRPISLSFSWSNKDKATVAILTGYPIEHANDLFIGVHCN